MSPFENATKFFDNCESMRGWEACKDLVADGATFYCQSQALAEITTVKAYVDWMQGFEAIAPDTRYEINASAYDESTQTALFFATTTATHTGDAGPVPPTNKTTKTHYVHALKMNADGKVERMTKTWNAPWALRELGWM